jgi:uncharacterized protein
VKRFATLAIGALACGAACFALGLQAVPAAARDFVQDQAAMFSPATAAALDQRIGNFNAQTGKEVVVVTVPSLGGSTLQSAAQAVYAQQNVNGVLIFIARDDRKDIIVPGIREAQAGWFTPEILRTIRHGMEAQFKAENYDAGITGAVGAVLNVYRAHLSGLRPGSGALAPAASRVPASSTGGFQLSMFWWIVLIVVGFLVVRSIVRAASAPRYYGGPVPPGAAGGPGYGPGYGGYGPGYGGWGGGGSFWSGLLGGLGGAWLGNELFGQRAGGGMIAPADAGQVMQQPDAGGGWGGGDAGGWQPDAGQADMGAASAGDWSGGGFGADMGGGDMGGGW